MSKQDRQGSKTPADVERKYGLGQTLSEIEEATRKQSDQISRQNSTMNDFMERSESEKASFEKSLSNVEKNVSTLKQNVTSLQIRMTNAEKKDKELSQSIYKLSQNVSSSGSSYNARLNALQNSVNDLAKRVLAAEETLADLVERVTALEST